MLEYKSIPQFTKEIDGRTVVGVFAVHGNVDSGGDRSWPGAFADTTAQGRDRVQFLWQHNSWEPPIAAINYIKEIGRDALPAPVLGYAPTATGGVEVSRTYFENSRAQEIFEGVSKKAIREMSYAYNALQYDFEESDGKHIRNLRKVELYDVSDVNWGMNPATAGMKSLQRLLESEMPFTEHASGVESALTAFVERATHMQEVRAKEGRVLSDANRKRIEALVASLKSMTNDLGELLAATAPKADPQEALALLVEWQRTLAKLNGVSV